MFPSNFLCISVCWVVKLTYTPCMNHHQYYLCLYSFWPYFNANRQCALCVSAFVWGAYCFLKHVNAIAPCSSSLGITGKTKQMFHIHFFQPAHIFIHFWWLHSRYLELIMTHSIFSIEKRRGRGWQRIQNSWGLNTVLWFL